MKNLKAIEWSYAGTLVGPWWGDTPFGRYYISNRHDWYTCEYKYQKLKSFRSLDAAKAFCSAHHAALVASLFDDAAPATKGTS